jgi:hypothetical protein
MVGPGHEEAAVILTAHQVGYLPWLGFFEKLARADLFCSFDAVQYEKKGWINRNYIKTAQGPLMLTVPVASKDHFDTLVKDVEIVPGRWTHKHMRSIELAYRRAPHFEQHFAGVGAILDLYAEGGLLAEMNMDLLRYFMKALRIQVPIVKASDYQFQGVKSDLVLDMCRQLGACEYVFGGLGDTYADHDAFAAAGVKAVFQNYQHPTYQQLHGPFTPNMSIVDLLMNCGPNARAVLEGKPVA